MDINELSRVIHKTAQERGFWEGDKSEAYRIEIVLLQIFKALGAYRKNKYSNREAFLRMKSREQTGVFTGMFNRDTTNAAYAQHIRGTFEDHFADTAICLLDLAGYLKMDFTKSPSCEFCHNFGQNSFEVNTYIFANSLIDRKTSFDKRILFALTYLFSWADALNIDLRFFVNEKVLYNQSSTPSYSKTINELEQIINN